LAESAAKNEAPAPLSEALKRGLREGGVILLGVLAVMLLAALSTWNPSAARTRCAT